MEPKHVPFVIERARAEDGAALLQYLKIIGGETNNLSFGPEGVPLIVEAEEAYLRAHWQPGDLVITMSCGNINLLNAQIQKHGD